jgi:hypothetical protein
MDNIKSSIFDAIAETLENRLHDNGCPDNVSVNYIPASNDLEVHWDNITYKLTISLAEK